MRAIYLGSNACLPLPSAFITINVPVTSNAIFRPFGDHAGYSNL
jgi:hypothetical protein